MWGALLTAVGLVGLFSFGFICTLLWENLVRLVQDRGRYFGVMDWLYEFTWMTSCVGLTILSGFCILKGIGVI